MNQLGETALLVAANGGHAAVVTMLLDAKAKVNHASNVSHVLSDYIHVL